MIVAFIGLFMTTDLSRPVWTIVPKLGDIQFPYRWLSVVSVVICPVIALGLFAWRDRMRERNIRIRHVPFAIAFAASILITGYELVINSTFLTRAEFTEHIGEIRAARSFKDWLPHGASELKDLKPLTGPIDPSGRELIASSFETHRRRFTLSAGDATDIRLRTYYYPLWQATVITANGTSPAKTNKLTTAHF